MKENLFVFQKNCLDEEHASLQKNLSVGVQQYDEPRREKMVKKSWKLRLTSDPRNDRVQPDGGIICLRLSALGSCGPF
jgi:hypothetical protein